MTARQLADRTRNDSDARLALGAAAACAVGLAAFVVAPSLTPDQEVLPGLGALGAIAAVFTVFLAPVAAGLAGYASFSALWAHGATLTTRARRQHLVTLVVVAGFFVALTLVWESGALAWLDD